MTILFRQDRHGNALNQGTSTAPSTSLRCRAPRGGSLLPLRGRDCRAKLVSSPCHPRSPPSPPRWAGRHRARVSSDSFDVTRSGARPECDTDRPSGRYVVLGLRGQIANGPSGSNVVGSRRERTPSLRVGGEDATSRVEDSTKSASCARAQRSSDSRERAAGALVPGSTLVEPSLRARLDQDEFEGGATHLGGRRIFRRWKAKSSFGAKSRDFGLSWRPRGSTALEKDSVASGYGHTL
jgi:hypothetical protein